MSTELLVEHVENSIKAHKAQQMLHKEWFVYHEKICNLFYDSGSRGWFSNKNSPKRLDMKEQSRVDIYYEELLEVNKLLLHKLEILLQRVSTSRMIDDRDIIETKKLFV